MWIDFDFQGFNKWLDENDIFYQRFIYLAGLIEQYLLENVLINPEQSALIAQRFNDVLSRCDTIDFDEPGVVQAYSILHFLDRYRRFQLIFLHLLENKILPVKNLPFDALDVGTGPGPTMFALSDIYLFLQQYGLVVSDQVLNKLEIKIDYVERSTQFRQWLHSFTEFVNMGKNNSGVPWKVPYHHGTFIDFTDIDFEKERLERLANQIRNIKYEYAMNQEKIPSTKFIMEMIIGPKWKNQFHFDLISFSNFLTEVEQINQLAERLRISGQSLRSKGSILIVGGRGGDYGAIYKSARQVLCREPYIKKKSISRISEIKQISKEMSYSMKDRFGIRIRNIFETVLRRLDEHNATQFIDKKVYQDIVKEIKEGDSSRSWEVHIYRKSSWPPSLFRK